MQVQRTEHTVKNRFKSIVSRQRKLHPGVSSEKELLRLLIEPEEREAGESQPGKGEVARQRRVQLEIKAEYHSAEVEEGVAAGHGGAVMKEEAASVDPIGQVGGVVVE